jgi:hypothetical protein
MYCNFGLAEDVYDIFWIFCQKIWKIVLLRGELYPLQTYISDKMPPPQKKVIN